MSTKIFVDQENIADTILSKDHLKRSALENPLKGHMKKGFVSSGSVEKIVRKALGNVNKTIVNQKSVPTKESELKVKKPSPLPKKVSEDLFYDEQTCPEIEKLFPYNPEDFETFDVPEEHKLSRLCLAGVPLAFNESGANRFNTLNQELAPMDIPVFSWELEASAQHFLATVEEITIDLPAW